MSLTASILRGSPYSFDADLPSLFLHGSDGRIRGERRDGVRQVLIECITSLLMNIALDGRCQLLSSAAQ